MFKYLGIPFKCGVCYRFSAVHRSVIQLGSEFIMDKLKLFTNKLVSINIIAANMR